MALSLGLRQVQKQTRVCSGPTTSSVAQNLTGSSSELRSAILEELQTNPLLDEVGSNDESLDAEDTEPSPDEITEEQGNDLEDSPAEQDSANETSQDSDEDWDEPVEDLTDLDFSDEFSVLQEMQEDLREHYERSMRGRHNWGIPKPRKKESSF